MKDHWLSFAKTGDPNADGLATWPRYNPGSDENMTFTDPPKAASGLQKEGCDFWDSYLAE